MGKEIEKIALQRGHQIILKTTSDLDASVHPIKNADVAIDFSIPSAAVHNITTCINHHIPVISGTTGLPASARPWPGVKGSGSTSSPVRRAMSACLRSS